MDPARLRAQMPALADCTYLNTGASGPSPRPVVEAATDFTERQEYHAPAGEGMYSAAGAAAADARETIADFLGATPAAIALTRSTEDGINHVAGAIDWQPGDVVVRTDLEHPAGVLPWRRLADVHDLEVRVLETEAGRLDLEAVTEAVQDARLVCLSSLSWNYGTRLRVHEVVERAHEAGAFVLVDGVQSVGQVPVAVDDWGADAVAASGHKWLLGIWGGGFLYVDRDALSDLRPRRIGSQSVVDTTGEDYELVDTARRFEVDTPSLAPHTALATAIETLTDVGLDTVQARIERLTDRLKAGLGDRVISPRAYESGLVAFTDDEPDRTVRRLAEDNIQIRSIPDPYVLRASVHAFNTAEDIDRLLDALDES
jgi:cysteine desulfurase/selenocysteine lyase